MSLEDFVFYFVWGCAIQALNNPMNNFEQYCLAQSAGWFCKGKEKHESQKDR